MLLVEDQPQNLEHVRRAWCPANVTDRIHVAGDGAEALDFLSCKGTHAARKIEDLPKVLLLDLHLLPVDGLEALRQLKADPRISTIPVVVLTSSREPNGAVESGQMGVNNYIVKPVNSGRFAEAVQQLGMYWLLLIEVLSN